MREIRKRGKSWVGWGSLLLFFFFFFNVYNYLVRWVKWLPNQIYNIPCRPKSE
jgi:hypothetical protein